MGFLFCIEIPLLIVHALLCTDIRFLYEIFTAQDWRLAICCQAHFGLNSNRGYLVNPVIEMDLRYWPAVLH